MYMIYKCLSFKNKRLILLCIKTLKWVGGKTQIIDSIIDNFPKKMNNYHEIFLGG